MQLAQLNLPYIKHGVWDDGNVACNGYDVKTDQKLHDTPSSMV